MSRYDRMIEVIAKEEAAFELAELTGDQDEMAVSENRLQLAYQVLEQQLEAMQSLRSQPTTAVAHEGERLCPP